MTLKDILLGGGGLVVVMTIIQIVPIKLNPWSWIASKIESAFNKTVLSKISDINGKVGQIEDKIDALEKQIQCVEDKIATSNDRSEEREIKLCRTRMLRFGDELLHDVEHSKDHFDQILLDCTEYERYCSSHPNFENNIVKQTINLIELTYKECMEKKSFL